MSRWRWRNRGVVDADEPGSPAGVAGASGAPSTGMPLELAEEGLELELLAVHGGRTFRHRLAEMGLTAGSRFRLINRGAPGPFILEHLGVRLMLGRGAAGRVVVRLAGGGCKGGESA